MDLNIIEEKDNKFFKRTEVLFSVKHPKMSTPSKEQLEEELGKKYKKETDFILIDYIFTKKGMNESVVKAKICEEKQIKEKKEKKPKEEKPEAKPKQEKPKEEPKEEKKEVKGDKSEAQADKKK